MKKIIMGAIASIALISSPVFAQDASAIKWSFSASAATDYMWRGVSQTDNNPAVFVTAQANVGNFYLGAGTENVDFLGIDQEYDFWAGYVFDLGGPKLDIGLVRYGYVDSPIDIDTLEGKVTLSNTFGKTNLGATIMYTPDYFGSSDAATYFEVSGARNFTDKFSVSGALGYQSLDNNNGDYSTWNIGIGYNFTPKVGIDVRYHDNDIKGNASVNDAKLVGSIKISF